MVLCKGSLHDERRIAHQFVFPSTQVFLGLNETAQYTHIGEMSDAGGADKDVVPELQA